MRFSHTTMLLLSSLAGVWIAGCGQPPAPATPASSAAPTAPGMPVASGQAASRTPAESLANIKPDFVLTTKEIRAKDDAGEARTNLVGKVIEVQAPLNIIDQTEAGLKFNLKSEGDTAYGVDVYMRDPVLPWKLALPPQVVTIRARGKASLPFSLMDGEIVKVEGDRCPTVTAEELAKSWSDGTFGKKYQFKYCIVEGTVSAVKDNSQAIALSTRMKSSYTPSLSATVRLEASGDHNVVAYFSSQVEAEVREAMALKKGDKIRVGSPISEQSLPEPQIKLGVARLLKD